MEFELKPRRIARVSPLGSFQFGIEEEYFLCDGATLQPAMSTPETLFAHGDAGTGARLNREMLQAQAEVATHPHTSCRNARDELIQLRHVAAQAAAKHGLAILASGTPPPADWRAARPQPPAAP